MTGLNARVAALVVLLVLVGTIAWGAVAAFAPASNSGNNGPDYTTGYFSLDSDHANNQSVQAWSIGEISVWDSTLDWNTYANDKGQWAGAIDQAALPRWEVHMRTRQPVNVSAVSGNDTLYAVGGTYKSHYYRSEARHLGWGLVNDAVLVYDGAHFHIGNGETILDEVHWYSVSPTQQIPYAYRRRATGTLTNVQTDENGAFIFMEETVEYASQNDSLGVVVDLNQKTLTARLRHKRYYSGDYNWDHEVELDANGLGILIVTTVRAYDDSLPVPELGSWVIG